LKEQLAIQQLLAALEARRYHFITPTPTTHARVIARRSEARDLRDVFGWSLPFARGCDRTRDRRHVARR